MNKPEDKSKISRRQLLKRVSKTVSALGLAGIGYSYFESGWTTVHRTSISLPNLPEAFKGTKIAFLTDIHHGPFISLRHIQNLVQTTNELKPDVIVMGGDYVHKDRKYIAPCFNALSKLESPNGTFGVLGNHDHWESAPETRQAMKDNEVIELTNAGKWLKKNGEKVWLGGVDDLWCGKQDLDKALGEATDEDAVILLCHNPDYVEGIRDRRVGLVLSGHTHGGQAVLPFIGAPFVPSRYGQKYLNGLIKTEYTQVFVSKGLGTVTPPLRFCCRPEIVLITLK